LIPNQPETRNPKPETESESQFAFIAPAKKLPRLPFSYAGEDKVYVAVAAEDVAAFQVNGEAEGADDAGLGAVFEEGLGDDLIPLELNQAGILE